MAAKTAQGTDDLKLVWQPLDIGATRVRNRTMMTAMGVFYGEDNLRATATSPSTANARAAASA